MKYPRAILVPLDLSEYSFTALAYAEDLAALFPQARISVVCVDETKTEEGPREVDAALLERTRTAVMRMMIEKQISHQGLNIVVRHGKPACTIVRTAKELSSDLIVMCTHGRTGLGHVLMGSVAEKVVRHAPCPVLTIKPEAFHELIALSEDDIAGCLHLQASS